MTAVPAGRNAGATSAGTTWVYRFDELDRVEAEHEPEDWDDVKSLLGGKGANLFEMTRLGVPVPPEFTVTTEACNAYLAQDRSFPPGMWEQEVAALEALELQVGEGSGDAANPLLVSCRSGSKFSMPGMMDTVLNLGLNDASVEGMITRSGDERFVYDAYRRLVQMFGCVVMGMPDEPFEAVIEEVEAERGVHGDEELDAGEWRRVTERFKKLYRGVTGNDFTQDPFEQLELATRAVFNSWFGKRAVDYRNATGIRHDLGTAVSIQVVVFGNMGERSGTGVAFTRDPADGRRVLYGDYLMNAQGEDVVAGIRNTKPIAELHADLLEAFAQFTAICDRLEQHFKDMQDVEFTIERGTLWMLQTRVGKRTARTAIRIAVEMANEGLIERREALRRVTPDLVDILLHPQFTLQTKMEAAARGDQLVEKAVNASPGAAVGVAAFDADTAEAMAKDGADVIMVRTETRPDDVHGMIASKGILTSRGGATSHAAVVARQFGTPAVCGADALKIDVEGRKLNVTTETGRIEINEGEWLSIDGGTGEVFRGRLPTQEPDFEREEELRTLLTWADEVRRLGIRANADYPKDAQRARDYGAEGIGLCRTMEGRPVIIRLLDPPLHEFLPGYEELVQELADLKVRLQHFHTLSEIDDALREVREKEDMLHRVAELREANTCSGCAACASA